MEQGLPIQVQKQLDEAEAIEKALAEQSTQQTQDTETQTTTAEATEVKTETEPETKPEPKEVTPSEDDTWKAKFSSLQGKYNAEVPRLHQQLREANESLQALRAQVERLSEVKQEQPEVTGISQDDEEAFGSDLIKVVQKIAKQEASKVAKDSEAKVNKVVESVKEVKDKQAETAGDIFMRNIADAVPDWEVINADQRWLDWLAEYSPESGSTRQAALDQAAFNLDHVRTVALFNKFKETLPKPKQTTTDKSQQELHSQVAPSKTTSSAPAPTAERIWTGKEYEAAFDVRNTQTMTKEEVDVLQAEADKAFAEGRIRW